MATDEKFKTLRPGNYKQLFWSASPTNPNEAPKFLGMQVGAGSKLVFLWSRCHGRQIISSTMANTFLHSLPRIHSIL